MLLDPSTNGIHIKHTLSTRLTHSRKPDSPHVSINNSLIDGAGVHTYRPIVTQPLGAIQAQRGVEPGGHELPREKIRIGKRANPPLLST